MIYCEQNSYDITVEMAFSQCERGVLDNAAKPERVIQKGKKLFLQPTSREPQFAGEAFEACATIPGVRRLCLVRV